MDTNIPTEAQNPIASNTTQVTGQITTTTNNAESAFFGVSVRAWVCMILVLAVVSYPFLKISSDIVNNLCISVISFYFGKMQNSK